MALRYSKQGQMFAVSADPVIGCADPSKMPMTARSLMPYTITK